MKIDHPKVDRAIRGLCAEHALALGVLVVGLWTMPLTAPYVSFVIDVIKFDLYSLRHVGEIVDQERPAQTNTDPQLSASQK